MKLLLDTHILIWMLEGSDRVSVAARARLRHAADAEQLLVSAITPWEIGMLTAKGRLKLSREVNHWLAAALALPGIHLEPLSPAIAVDSSRLPGELHGDPVDRILVATARHADATLMTADQRLLNYAAQGFVHCLPPA